MRTYVLGSRVLRAALRAALPPPQGRIFSPAPSPGARSSPPSARWAENLNVSRITVENAYQQLLTEGYLVSKPRSGYYAEHLEDAAPGHRAGDSPRCGAPWGAGDGGERGAVSLFGVGAAYAGGAPRRAGGAAPGPSPARDCPRCGRPLPGCSCAAGGWRWIRPSIVIGAGAEYLYTLLFQLLGAGRTSSPWKIPAIESCGRSTQPTAHRSCPLPWTRAA